MACFLGSWFRTGRFSSEARDLADVNGIRKVLPNIEHYFWSSSSYSYARYYALEFSGVSGQLGYEVRSVDDYVRCVAFVRE